MAPNNFRSAPIKFDTTKFNSKQCEILFFGINGALTDVKPVKEEGEDDKLESLVKLEGEIILGQKKVSFDKQDL